MQIYKGYSNLLNEKKRKYQVRNRRVEKKYIADDKKYRVIQYSLDASKPPFPENIDSLLHKQYTCISGFRNQVFYSSTGGGGGGL